MTRSLAGPIMILREPAFGTNLMGKNRIAQENIRRLKKEVKMNLPENTAPAVKPKTRWLLLVAYVPLCYLVIGLIAYYMRLKAIGLESFAFKDVFWSHAIPRPGTLSGLHLPALAIGLIILFLMISLSYSAKPVMTLFQVRILLLVLIAVLTILALIMATVIPLVEAGAPKLPLFLLFADIDIVLVFLLTHSPTLSPAFQYT